MAYQYVRGPLTLEDADRLASACETAQEKLILWPLLDGGLRVSELCSLTPKHVQWQQRCLRIRGSPFGKSSNARVVPISNRVRTIFEPYFALNDTFPVGPRQAQKIVKRVANGAMISVEVMPHPSGSTTPDPYGCRLGEINRKDVPLIKRNCDPVGRVTNNFEKIPKTGKSSI